VTPRAVVPLALRGADRAWRFVLDLAGDPQAPPWVLVGGLMVELHAHEHDVVPVRVTDDADVLVDLFADRNRTERLAEALVDRYRLSFDVPGPDGVGTASATATLSWTCSHPTDWAGAADAGRARHDPCRVGPAA